MGPTIVAAWLRLGNRVCAIDRSPATIEALRRANPPVDEPGVSEALRLGIDEGQLQVSTDFESACGARFCFIAHDSDLDARGAPITDRIYSDALACAAQLDAGSIIVLSAQVPVGVSRRLRAALQSIKPTLELVYSPENLRLGEALNRYLNPGQIVIGAAHEGAQASVAELFAPMNARILCTSLETAEVAKHALNAYLATSVALANNLADVCVATGAQYDEVAAVLQADPRIGPHAYLAPGLGFAGGTLGRDLRVLDDLNRDRLQGSAPLFGQVLSYNEQRIEWLATNLLSLVPRSRAVCLLGATYKPGTSTLRGSATVTIARRLLAEGRLVRIHDPQALWSEESLGDAVMVSTPQEGARDAEVVVVMTEWPEYASLDAVSMASVVRRARLVDPKGHLRSRAADLRAAGWDVSFSIWPLPTWLE